MLTMHILRAARAVTTREVTKFAQQTGRLLSGVVRPLFWLLVFAAGFQNVFGVSIIPPYTTYITYQTYVTPGLLGIVLLFNGFLSSLAMVYDREMGIMRLLLTAPLPRWILLACKLFAGATLSIIQAYVFLFIASFFDIDFPWSGYITVFPALALAALMLGSIGLLLSVYVGQMENFASAMNFVIFPMFFTSSALYPLWKLREGGAEIVYLAAVINPFTYAVELCRFALYGMIDWVSLAVVIACAIGFFVAAMYGYDPQRGIIRRARGPAAAT